MIIVKIFAAIMITVHIAMFSVVVLELLGVIDVMKSTKKDIKKWIEEKRYE